MLDVSEELSIHKKNELIIADKCVKIKNNYFCDTSYNKAQTCIRDIIGTQNNTFCMYHKVHNPMFVLKIKNSNITIIASNENKKLKLICEKFEETNIVSGVFRFENNGYCTLNNRTLHNIKYYNKELIFENINLELKEHQISNNADSFDVV